MTDKFLSVAGDPIEHSLSPLIHSIAYEHLGLDWRYDRNRVGKDELEQFLGANKKYSGLSLTMPLKDEAFYLSNQLSPEAEKTRVVNTMHLANGVWHGANTDVYGITQAISGIETAELTAVAILGSGATARSALHALEKALPGTELNLYARTPTAFFTDLEQRQQYLSIRPLSDFVGKENLVLNTTPVDLSFVGAVPSYWMNTGYSNKFGVPSGSTSISPLEMLLWQAIAQIRIFTLGDAIMQVTNEDELILKIRHALEVL